MIVNQQVWYTAAEQYLLLGWSTDEWIKKMWYTYPMEHYSVLKEEWSHTICSNMDGLVILSHTCHRDCHTKWGKWDRERQIWYHLYVESKTWHKWTYPWKRLTDIENRLVAKWVVGEGWIGFSKCKLLHKFSSVQSLSHVRLFATPWTATHQASLSITNSRSLPKLMSIESVMPSNHLNLCRPLLLPPSISPSIRVFSNEKGLVFFKWELKGSSGGNHWRMHSLRTCD